MKKRTFKNEGALVSAMKKALAKELGGRWIKIHGGPFQEKGLSDIIGCLDGLFIAIEVKMPGRESKVTDMQRRFLSQVTENGGLALISSDIDATIEIIDEKLGGEPNWLVRK